MLSLLFTHIITSHQIYVAIDNALLVLSISCLTTSSYLWHSLHRGYDVTHADNLQCNSCLYFSHLYTFRDGIQVTWVCMYFGECQGYPVLNEHSIFVQYLDFESPLQLPREMTIQRTITPPWALLYPHPVMLSVPSAPALAYCASTHLRYAFTF